MAEKQHEPMEKDVILDKIAALYNVSEDFDHVLLTYNYSVAMKHFKGNCFLELGTSRGESTNFLLNFASSIDVVEGAEINVQATLDKFRDNPAVKVFHSYWENYEYPEKKYSDILWFRGLEHIHNPGSLLGKMKKSLIPGGRIHIVVPNAFSLHRRVGFYMGMLSEPHVLGERDKEVGHVKIYDRFEIIELLRSAGYSEYHWEGMLIKALPNPKMMALYKENPKLIEAFFSVGKEYPDLCAEIYVCGSVG